MPVKADRIRCGANRRIAVEIETDVRIEIGIVAIEIVDQNILRISRSNNQLTSANARMALQPSHYSSRIR
ncbi:MAG: hypothetical protein R3C26_18815 [Calditrichia bacterium]